MDRKLLIARLEVVFGVILIVAVAIGIVFFAFRSIPALQPNQENPINDPLFGETIKFLDITDAKEFSISTKKVILPENGKVLSAYNNYSGSMFECKTELSQDCTIYELDIDGRNFNMSAPIQIKLRQPTAAGNVKKKLVVAGEEVEFTYTQRKFVKTTVSASGEVETVEDVPEQTNVEEIFGCLNSGICFNSGNLVNDKAENDIAVAAFEKFVESVVIN